METEERPSEAFTDIVQSGLDTFKSAIQTITGFIRTGDSALRELDGALTGRDASMPQTPEGTVVDVITLIEAAVQEAKEHQSASAPAVVQRARQVLNRVTSQEPAWRPGPSLIRTANDVLRVALRDLRGSEHLLKLAQGTGTLEDLESLTKWVDEISQRISTVQRVVAQPTPVPVAPAPSTPPVSPGTEKKLRKRDTTPKIKPKPEDVVFAQAVAEEMGDPKVKGWAKEFADGKISEQQWINRLTTHAAATRDSLDDIFSRASERIARESHDDKA